MICPGSKPADGIRKERNPEYKGDHYEGNCRNSKTSFVENTGRNGYKANNRHLFSGSGGIGIEALSRGARHAYFAENAKDAIACIQANLSTTRFEDKATLLKQDAVSALSLISEKEVDIVFMDPPYQLQVERNVFSALKQQKYITEDTLIITEAALDRDFSFVEELGFTIVREKRYKTNKHVFCRKAAQ